jgi:curved DNA-binding protein CbpA
MLQTASSVFFGPLPEVSNAHVQSPQDVRKTYLRVVRCCHPDKQPVEAPPRVRAQAAKVFSALSDAYATYKQQVNE